jgi:hypothetical protein
MTLTISRILHAGYVFACDGTRIAFDPIVENPFSRNCHAFPDVAFDLAQFRAQHFDAVFISHFHDDHCSFDSLDLIDRATPLYVYCIFDALFALLRELGFVNVYPLTLDVPVRIGAITVTPRRADDADVDSLFQVQAAGMNVLNVVDAWIAPETLPLLARFAPWDMVLWPFQTMRETDVLAPTRAPRAAVTLPEEWAAQLQALRPRYVVPSSCQFVQEPWSWYNHALFPVSYRQFADELAGWLPEATLLRLNPSVSVALDAAGARAAPPLPWVLPIGPQDVDYDYHAQATVPTTAAIARHFPALSSAQAARVRTWCDAGLAARYGALEAPEDSYFDVPRVWRLSVFDHDGGGTHYRYLLDGERATPLADGDTAAPAWTTEIPAAKLYAALDLGEALTSLYLRINDYAFDAATDAELALADLIDDPLVRCLYNDRFGAYQAAQLRRLRAGAPQAAANKPASASTATGAPSA